MPKPTVEEMDQKTMELLERLVEAIENQTAQLAALTVVVDVRLGEVRDCVWEQKGDS